MNGNTSLPSTTTPYDDDGNEVLSENKTFGYNNGILASYTDGTSAVTYQTDAMGNPIRISGGGVVKTLSWGEGRMLLGVQTNASNYSQYTYDVDGLRTRKVVAVNGIRTTTEYAWGDNGLAGTIIRDGTATTTVIPHYDIEGEAVGFTVKCVPSRLSSPSTTNTYTYVKNLQGDVLRILDSNGNAVVNYTYDPWGKPTVAGDEELAAVNPCSYRGYDYDEETEYYYLQSRYYDPNFGRFISVDDTGVLGASTNDINHNLFAYCANNPINHIDILGYAEIKITWIATTINLIVALIPALVSLNNILRSAGKGSALLAKISNALTRYGKRIIKKIDDWLYWNCATELGYNLAKWVGKLGGIISVFTSIGGIVQYLVDCLDGRWDGIVNTSVKLRLRIVWRRG